MISRSRVTILALALVGAALPLTAQQRPPECQLNYRSNFRLNGAQQHLSVAENATYEPDKVRRANDAIRTLTDAVQAGGGVDPTTLWMFFGRAYAIKHDLAGADSSFRKAEATATDACKSEIDRLRHNLFVPFSSAAIGAMQQEQWDSALAAFRNGLVIYNGDPSVYVNMGSIFLNKSSSDTTRPWGDSAVAYWRKGAHTGSDPRTENMRMTALFNASRLLQRAQKWATADTVLHDYLASRPHDAEARSALATVLIAEGRRDAALAVYDSVISNDSSSSFDLFDVGVSLFRQGNADTARADSAQRMRIFAKAAQAFETGLRKNPNIRDGWYDLTNTYMAMGDSTRLLAAAKRLARVDPMNSQSLRLLAASYQKFLFAYDQQLRAAATRRDTATVHRLRPVVAAWQDSTVKALARSDSLPLEISITQFQPGDSSVTIRGAVMNRQPTEKAAFTLFIDLLAAGGDVVSQQTVDIPAMGASGSAGAAYPFELTAPARNVIAYRYRLQ